MKSKGLLLLLAGVVLGFTLALGGAVVAGLSDPSVASRPGSLPWAQARLLAEVLERVKREYVETVSDEQLMENAMRGMVRELDPHSQFLSADQYEEIRISTSGNYSGVGLEVHMEDGRVTVVSPIEGTPAARAGVRSGDYIRTIDGRPVDDRSISDTIVRMRGKAGTHVLIGVERPGNSELLAYDLVRSSVRVRSVRGSVLAPGYGYIRVTQFSDTTARDLRKEIASLDVAAGPLRGVVLDLRNNPGGVLEAAVESADLFLDEGVIVTASGRTPDATFRHAATPGDVLDGAPLMVIVNAGSASASEIVAGALQDNGRATIAGQRTFGKGSVQTVMPLSDGHAIKLTTSRYFTPSGDSIQGSGIEPDVVFDEQAAAPALADDRSSGAQPAPEDADIRRALQLLQTRMAFEGPPR